MQTARLLVYQIAQARGASGDQAMLGGYASREIDPRLIAQAQAAMAGKAPYSLGTPGMSYIYTGDVTSTPLKLSAH